MAKAKYEIAGPRPVAGHEVGKIVTADDFPEGVNVEALVAGGILVAPTGKGKAAEVEQIPCPACSETMKRPPKFDSYEDLRAHYLEKHPALAAPAGEEG